ncbi:hypothetical protein MMC29_006979 [Sticta canariensis]|nr:hypothetical protein [Sticta canariensis]
MSQNDLADRRHECIVLVAVSATAFWAAIMTAIARTVIVFRFQKRLFIEDVVLLIAVACLCAAAGVMIISFPSMALLEEFFTEPLPSELPSNGIEKAQYRIIQLVCVPLCLTTIYAARFSFLLFLGPLTRPFRNLTLYSNVVSMVTIVAWAFFGASIAFIPSDNNGSKTSQFRRHGYSSIVPDIITTLLVMPIPIYLASRIQNDIIERKFALNLSIGLSNTMIWGSFVFIYGFEVHSKHPVNGIWFVFWQLIEACVMVLMMSVALFFFILAKRALSRDQLAVHPTQRISEDRPIVGEEELSEEPETLTENAAHEVGLRTFVEGGDSKIKKETSDAQPLQDTV